MVPPCYTFPVLRVTEYAERHHHSPHGQVAQLVEHVTENHGVAGSIPALATSLRSLISTIELRLGKPPFAR
jgi:hypothetical protein